jgi:hypothetical protein
MSVQPDKPREVQWPKEKQYASLADRWFDVETVIDWVEAGVPATLYMAESFPMWLPNLGPEVAATVYGAELQFSPDTSWSVPVAQRARDVLDIQPNLEGRYWQAIRKGTDLSIARGAGEWVTGITDLHTNVDLLAALLDPQKLCTEFLDDPEGVDLAMQHLTSAFGLLFGDLYKRTSAAGQPATSWTPTLHVGPADILQADFICMISPEMFHRSVLPALTWECEYLQRSLYHLDGPRALCHLDSLLSIRALNGIQWVYGTGGGAAKDWIGVYQRIQQAGKCVQIICADLDDAKALLPHIRPAGAWFAVGGSYTLPQAEAFLKYLRDWTAGKSL